MLHVELFLKSGHVVKFVTNSLGKTRDKNGKGELVAIEWNNLPFERSLSYINIDEIAAIVTTDVIEDELE